MRPQRDKLEIAKIILSVLSKGELLISNLARKSNISGAIALTYVDKMIILGWVKMEKKYVYFPRKKRKQKYKVYSITPLGYDELSQLTKIYEKWHNISVVKYKLNPTVTVDVR